MQAPKRLVIVSEHYSPSTNTTSEILTTIATHMARHLPVLVLSGTPGSACDGSTGPLQVMEIRKPDADKDALAKRTIAEALFAIRAFFRLLRILSSNDAVLTVTAPFMLPYAVAAAARLRGARAILIMHDFYPDVLVLTGLLKATSIASRLIHGLNAIMFRLLDAVVIIGRETMPLLHRYKGLASDRIHLIPNWATLAPGVRAVDQQNRFRSACGGKFVVGLSGNLGFTHDPDVVFEAARLLQDDTHIHFLLSGWGIGFARLQQRQAAAALANVTLVDRVPAEHLDDLLAAADAWIIPYRAKIAGVSVPSRLYNLLAIGRPVLLVSDTDADAAHLLRDHDTGWVVAPGDVSGLAAAIRRASAAPAQDTERQRERAVAVSRNFSVDAAMAGYETIVKDLLA